MRVVRGRAGVDDGVELSSRDLYVREGVQRARAGLPVRPRRHGEAETPAEEETVEQGDEATASPDAAAD
jgi:hypothetical protein